MLQDFRKYARSMFRDVPLAFVCATTWFIVLWVMDYPSDYSVGVVVIGYVALWVSKAVLGNLILASLKRLNAYGRKALERAGVDLADQTPDARPARSRIAAGVFLLAVIATVVGASALPIAFIAAAVGLPPLDASVTISGAVMFGAGLVAIALFFAFSFALFSMTDSQHATRSVSARISRIEEAELLLRRLGDAPVRV